MNCLNIEDNNSISEFLTSNYSLKYTELKNLDISSEENISAVEFLHKTISSPNKNMVAYIHTRNGLSYISVQADNSDIKSVKNEHSRRSIPIHQQLIDWGFLEYVEEQQKKTTSDNNRLFPNITMHNKGDRYSASKYYNKYFGEVLKGINLEGKGYSSYSMRHTFMDYLRRAGYSCYCERYTGK